MEEKLELFINNIGLRHQVDRLRYKTDRSDIWRETRQIRLDLHRNIARTVEKAEILQRLTGLALAEYQTPPGVSAHRDGLPVFWVHSLREARRQREDGRVLNQVFITILQKETMYHQGQEHTIRCGSTLVLDLDEARVTYVIRKGLHDHKRLLRMIRFRESQAANASLSATYLGESSEPFAALHRSGA
jgi:hypothetical protein